MKKIIVFFLLSLTSTPFAKDAKYLFFQNASQASIVQQGDHRYLLTLTTFPDFVSFFSDRPVRQAGVIQLSQFILLWHNNKITNNFTENPPNAAIALVTEAGKQQNAIVEVTNPVYQQGMLTYQLRSIDQQTLASGKLKQITLFFDPIHWNPGGFGH